MMHAEKKTKATRGLHPQSGRSVYIHEEMLISEEPQFKLMAQDGTHNCDTFRS